MYVIPDNYTFDDFSSVLIDLNLIKKVEKDLYEFNYVTTVSPPTPDTLNPEGCPHA